MGVLLLHQKIAEQDALGLVADRVRIGDVARDHVHRPLLRLKLGKRDIGRVFHT